MSAGRPAGLAENKRGPAVWPAGEKEKETYV